MEKQVILLETVRKLKQRVKGKANESYKGYYSIIDKWVTEQGTIEEKNIFDIIGTNQIGTLVIFKYKGPTIVMGFSEKDKEGNTIYLEDGRIKRKYTDYEALWGLYGGIQLGARSTVIDVETMEIALSPYDKFFNVGEISELTEEKREEYNKLGIAEIEPTEKEVIKEKIKRSEKVEVVNKFDGSMIQARRYRGQLVWATSSVIGVEGAAAQTELVERVGLQIKKEPVKTMVDENTDKTLIFEYIGTENRIVVDYAGIPEQLVLIGVTDMETGEQYTYKAVEELGKKYKVSTIEVLEDKTYESIEKDMRTKDAMDFEGYIINIVAEGVSNRYKIKADDYTEVHRLLDSKGIFRVIIEAVADDKLDDIIAKVPNVVQPQVNMIIEKIYEYTQTRKKEIDKIIREIEAKIKTKEIEDTMRGKMVYITEEVDKLHAPYIRNIIKGIEINEMSVLKLGTRYRTPEEIGLDEEEQDRILTKGKWMPKEIDAIVKEDLLIRINKKPIEYIEKEEQRYLKVDNISRKEWDKQGVVEDIGKIIKTSKEEPRKKVSEINKRIQKEIIKLYSK